MVLLVDFTNLLFLNTHISSSLFKISYLYLARSSIASLIKLIPKTNISGIIAVKEVKGLIMGIL